MTDRQMTGVWFIVTGLLLLSFWVTSYALVNWALTSGFITLLNMGGFTSDQKFVLGASGVVTLQLVSLTGVPFVLAGLAQVITGASKSNKKTSK